jgi:hypothetical protein
MITLTERFSPEKPMFTATIWRYMRIPRFIHLLRERELYLPTLATLKKYDDPMEGHFPPECLENWVIDELAERGLSPPTAQYMEWRKEEMRPDRYQYNYLISCWNQSDDESQALWKLYGNSVAIKSTVQRLTNSIWPWAALPIVDYGRVEYKRHGPGSRWGHADTAIFHKDSSFRFEEEFRLVFWSFQPIKDENGRGIPIDPEKLIEQVVISPEAKPLKKLVERLVVKCGCPKIEVVASRL